jgi:hypothetical protein
MFVYLGIIFLFITLWVLYQIFTLKRMIEKDAKNNLPEDYAKETKDIIKNLDLLNLSNYWYPIMFSKDLSDKKPFGTKILGEPIVLYRTKDGKVGKNYFPILKFVHKMFAHIDQQNYL